MMTTPRTLGVALSGDAYKQFLSLTKRPRQELTTFFYWRPSVGKSRYTAVVDSDIPMPQEGETEESGNVAIRAEYLMRVLARAPKGTGIGVIHSHFGAGWQDLSPDDYGTEAEEFAHVAFASRDLPLLGMTVAVDGTLSARFWVKAQAGIHRADVPVVRVVGEQFLMFRRAKPELQQKTTNRIATISVWGTEKQAILESLKIGIVGLGSVGSMVAECLARMGVRNFVLVDHDRIKNYNLDRTVGASRLDVVLRRLKTRIAARNILRSSTATGLRAEKVNKQAQHPRSLTSLLDCDAIFSCVDRHLPRYVLNFLAISHLIPVVDGGIAVDLPTDKKPTLDISWRIHMARPSKACLGCLGAYEYSRIGLERDGLIEDRSYLDQSPELKKEYQARQNVFCFSMSCAAHEVLQLLGYLLDVPGVSPARPQMYQAGEGIMFGAPFATAGRCADDCQVRPFTARAHDLNMLL